MKPSKLLSSFINQPTSPSLDNTSFWYTPQAQCCFDCGKPIREGGGIQISRKLGGGTLARLVAVVHPECHDCASVMWRYLRLQQEQAERLWEAHQN